MQSSKLLKGLDEFVRFLCLGVVLVIINGYAVIPEGGDFSSTLFRSELGSSYGSNISFTASSRVKCASWCLLDQEFCRSFQYDSLTGECRLFQGFCLSGAENSTSVIQAQTGINTTTDKLLALNKPSSMSSTYGGYVASRGNDGDYPETDTGYFHTQADSNPYWRVDLEDVYCISAVYFMNRGHSISANTRERARNIVVTVSLSEDDIMDTGDNRCGYIDGIVETLDNTVTCEHTTPGRFVQLQMLETGILHFYEVEVHGY